jgi:hypothetical protein
MEMSEVQPLETFYRGYRFRSRLEARWAMFFDRVGWPWVYEPQPVLVNGEPYLPDFRVTVQGTEITHEVKASQAFYEIRPVKVYLAGKMKPQHEWRGRAAVTDGGFRAVHELDSPDAWVKACRRVTMGTAQFIMMGPFPISDDHRGAHADWACHMAEGINSDGVGRDPIFAAAFEAIRAADLVCAHINTADAFGTLVEIGIARGMGKVLSVTVDADLADSMRRPPAFFSDHNDLGAHDLWFAQVAANHAGTVNGVEEAQTFHSTRIAAATPRELRLMQGLAAGGAPAAMTFGDPLEVCNVGTAYAWGEGRLLHNAIWEHQADAEAIRAHRFDRR